METPDSPTGSLVLSRDITPKMIAGTSGTKISARMNERLVTVFKFGFEHNQVFFTLPPDSSTIL